MIGTDARERRAGIVAAVIALASLGLAAPAAASVTCVFTGTSGSSPGVVGVTLGAPGDTATISAAGGTIAVDGTPCVTSALLGETATTRTTDAVFVNDASGGPVDVRIADPAGFAPGLTAEGDNLSEMEFSIDLGGGPGDVLRLEAAGGDTEDRYELGVLQGAPSANFNARSEDGRTDADAIIGGVERTVSDGRALGDRLDGAGATSFATAYGGELELFGADGGDVLRGGDARDLIHGGPADDLLEGGAERDVLLGEGEEDVLAGGPDADRLDGGDDDDLADYRLLPEGTKRGVVATLGSGVVSGGGGGDRLVSIEGALGSPLDDEITGDTALNFIEGGGGADLLDGAGESDALIGSSGADELIGGAARDVLVGGPGDDVVTGEVGKDIVMGGTGRDRIDTAKGVDVVDVAGGGRDVVDCGPGRDGYDADRGDRLRSCEVKLTIDLKAPRLDFGP